jgi:hypothetical protein
VLVAVLRSDSAGGLYGPVWAEINFFGGVRMLVIDVRGEGLNKRFMTNDDGSYFFVIQDGAAMQIDCNSGYNYLPRIKKAIREYLKNLYSGQLGRLTYRLRGGDRWHYDAEPYRVEGSHIYRFENGSYRHCGRVYQWETRAEALRRVKINLAGIEKMESAGIYPEDFAAQEG